MIDYDVVECEVLQDKIPSTLGPITESEMRGSGVLATSNTSYILKENGQLLATGINSSGLLGTGDATSRKEHVIVSEEVSSFWSNDTSTLIQKFDGTFHIIGYYSFMPDITDYTSYTFVEVDGVLNLSNFILVFV